MHDLITELRSMAYGHWTRVNVHTPRGVFTRFKTRLVTGAMTLLVEVSLAGDLVVDGRQLGLRPEDRHQIAKLVTGLGAWHPRKPRRTT